MLPIAPNPTMMTFLMSLIGTLAPQCSRTLEIQFAETNVLPERRGNVTVWLNGIEAQGSIEVERTVHECQCIQTHIAIGNLAQGDCRVDATAELRISPLCASIDLIDCPYGHGHNVLDELQVWRLCRVVLYARLETL